MVHNYDIYYRRGPRSTQVYRVTNDAVPGIVYNGIPDWLYEGKVIIELIWIFHSLAYSHNSMVF